MIRIAINGCIKGKSLMGWLILPFLGHDDVLRACGVAVLPVEGLSRGTLAGDEVDRVYPALIEMILEMTQEPAAHARPLGIRPHAEGFQVEHVTPVVRLPVAGGERRYPFVQGHQ